LADAAIATSSPSFYNVTLKNLVIPWTNRDQTVFAPFIDSAATVIGMTRDDVAFNAALSDDILYVVNAPGLPAPSAANNNHYATAESNGADLSTVLQRTTQSGAYGTPVQATAGLITTRGAASAFFINGTNRAMFRFTMINHLCHDMETVMDTTRPADRIRRAVARPRGGDSRWFTAHCLGQQLASSDAFAQCQVTKVFQAVCFRAPVSAADQATVATIKASFKSGGYKLKQVFQLSAAACPGQ